MWVKEYRKKLSQSMSKLTFEKMFAENFVTFVGVQHRSKTNTRK